MRRALRAGGIPARAGTRTGALALALLTAVVGLGACTGSGPGSDEPSPTYAVARRTETLVDHSRPTEGRGDVAAKPSRTFETLVYYPALGSEGANSVLDAAPAAPGGPFPVVVFSHGSGVSNPARYELLFRAWTAAGYVVVAPKYPLTSTSLPEAGRDVVNQPADVTFLIDEMLRRSDDGAGPYAGLLDRTRIAAAGHSLGGMATAGLVSNGCCVDRRIRAGVVLAGAKGGFPDDRWFDGATAPLLVVHGDDDRLVRIQDGRKLFDDAPAPKAMLTVFGGDHNRPYGGSLTTTENPERLGATLDGPTRIVNATVVAFLDRHLKGRTDALDRLGATLVDEVAVKLEVVDA